MPSFLLRAVARVFDFGGGLHRGSYFINDTAAEADARALASDWAAIDEDLAVAAFELARARRAGITSLIDLRAG